jgi:hypothetical protein
MTDRHVKEIHQDWPLEPDLPMDCSELERISQNLKNQQGRSPIQQETEKRDKKEEKTAV